MGPKALSLPALESLKAFARAAGAPHPEKFSLSLRNRPGAVGGSGRARYSPAPPPCQSAAPDLHERTRGSRRRARRGEGPGRTGGQPPPPLPFPTPPCALAGSSPAAYILPHQRLDTPHTVRAHACPRARVSPRALVCGCHPVPARDLRPPKVVHSTEGLTEGLHSYQLGSMCFGRTPSPGPPNPSNHSQKPMRPQ